MQKATPDRGRWWQVVSLVITSLVVAADQYSKAWVGSYPQGQAIFQLGFFRIINTQNTGIAFGLLQGQAFTLALVALSAIIALLIFAFLFYRRVPWLNNRRAKLALGLILGGTAGNLVDRLRLGYVTDFIDFGVWPTFNLADSAITIGATLLAYFLLFPGARKPDLSS